MAPTWHTPRTTGNNENLLQIIRIFSRRYATPSADERIQVDLFQRVLIKNV